MFTTKHLRCILGNEPLSFKLPGGVFDNWTLHHKSGKKIPLDLHVMVFPDNRKKEYWDHKVLVNGIPQHSLNPGSIIYDVWFKTPQDKNHIWFKLMFDWRCLLNLDNKDLEYGVNILGDYLKDPIRYAKKYKVISEHGLYVEKKKGSYKKHPEKPNPRFKHTYKNRPPFEYTPYHLAYVRDVVTGAVERISREEAEYLINKHEHLEYCKKKHWKSYQKSQLPKYPVVEKSIYWSEEPNKVKDEEGNEVVTNSFIPKSYKYNGTTRKQRRDWKHKKELKHRKYGDMYQKHQTIVIPPKKEPEKYKIRTIVFDYEYVPMIFSSKNQPEIQTFLWPDGSPKMKKVYKGKREVYVTITERPRTTYKTIITRQYPPVITRKRAIVKKNIEFLKKQQEEEQSKKAE